MCAGDLFPQGRHNMEIPGFISCQRTATPIPTRAGSGEIQCSRSILTTTTPAATQASMAISTLAFLASINVTSLFTMKEWCRATHTDCTTVSCLAISEEWCISTVWAKVTDRASCTTKVAHIRGDMIKRAETSSSTGCMTQLVKSAVIMKDTDWTLTPRPVSQCRCTISGQVKSGRKC